MNGETVNTKLAAKGGRIDAFLAGGVTDAQLVDDAYLLALSRLPSETEKSQILETLSAVGAKQKHLLDEIEASYERNFARSMTPDERKTIEALVGLEKRLAVEDLFWGILSSKEFLFNH
jgi:hypothetical protein